MREAHNVGGLQFLDMYNEPKNAGGLQYARRIMQEAYDAGGPQCRRPTRQEAYNAAGLQGGGLTMRRSTLRGSV